MSDTWVRFPDVDIVEALRSMASFQDGPFVGDSGPVNDADILRAAADEIERLRQDIEGWAWSGVE